MAEVHVNMSDIRRIFVKMSLVNVFLRDEYTHKFISERTIYTSKYVRKAQFNGRLHHCAARDPNDINIV